MQSAIDHKDFQQEVLQSAIPVVVHFWAPWCGLCRMIEPHLNTLAHEFGTGLKLVGINADDNLHLASNYQIRDLPTVLIFEQGKLLRRIDQLHRKEELPRLLKDALQPLAVES
jgi:thioredoxin 1